LPFTEVSTDFSRGYRGGLAGNHHENLQTPKTRAQVMIVIDPYAAHFKRCLQIEPTLYYNHQ